MSDIIQLLPDSVANQIAAGEVIQRPASVIKELVENSVDAGATTIHVVVIDAGRTSIQVIDDGKGMSPTDARLAFDRHATSKIRKADDLFSLHTMGFRGEALPSIAAVAQVQLRTRQADEEVGTCLEISGSKVMSQTACSCPVGSNFKVDNLFFNVPARRKFLKSNTTELNNILTAFERIALVYPEIEFTFHSNGSEIYNLRRGNLHQRIADVFGTKFSEDLLPLNADTTLCRLSGYVGKPECSRKKCPQQYFFVNGRFMKHPYFAKAIQTSYERLIPMGNHVPYFIYFDVDPADIDVNIHPTKTEIKFENEQSIWQILTAALREAIGVFNNVPSIDFDTEGKPEIPDFGPIKSAVMPNPTYNPSYNPFKSDTKKAEQKPVTGWENLYHEKKPVAPIADLYGELLDMNEPSFKDEKASEHYQFKGQYIVTSVRSGMMVIEQTRAHVRVLYEQYMQQMQNRHSASQRMLFPEAVQLSATDAALLDTIIDEMTLMGFELSPLGACSYAINSVPAGLEGINPSNLVKDMVDDVIQEGSTVMEEINRTLALSMARKAAIPHGQILSNEEMDDLVTKLFSCENMNYTPDGKRIFFILSDADITQRL